jgi:hypothetical protein
VIYSADVEAMKSALKSAPEKRAWVRCRFDPNPPRLPTTAVVDIAVSGGALRSRRILSW